MPGIDMPLRELQDYRPELFEPQDFDTFWQKTLDELRQDKLEYKLTPSSDFPGKHVQVFDLSFSGYRGHEIRGWYLRPAFAPAPHPMVVVYHGYRNGRALPSMYAHWLLMGCAVLTMDTRGQGGATGNPLGYANPSAAGWMTQGLPSPETYYYRAVFSDAVRILDVAFALEESDQARVVTTGISQGGGICIAASALDARVAFAMPDVPFLCHYRRGVAIAPRGPYPEIADYLRRFPDKEEETFRTLSYFDGANFAPRLRAKSLWSVALWDDTCPPSTVFAAYNRCGGDKEIAIYPYNNHEGGGFLQARRQLQFVSEQLGL